MMTEPNSWILAADSTSGTNWGPILVGIVIVLGLLTISGFIGAAIGRRNGNEKAGFALGFFLSWVGWIIAALLRPSVDNEVRRTLAVENARQGYAAASSGPSWAPPSVEHETFLDVFDACIADDDRADLSDAVAAADRLPDAVCWCSRCELDGVDGLLALTESRAWFLPSTGATSMSWEHSSIAYARPGTGVDDIVVALRESSTDVRLTAVTDESWRQSAVDALNAYATGGADGVELWATRVGLFEP